MELIIASIMGGVILATMVVLVLATLATRTLRAKRAAQHSLPDQEFFIPTASNLPPNMAEQAYVQPETDSTFLESLGLVKKQNFDEFPDPATTKDYLGRLNFGLSYDKEHGLLSVHLIQAVHLPGKDLGGTADPYVRVFLVPESAMGKNVPKSTRIHKRTTTPKFHQTLTFNGFSAKKLEEMTLCLQVIDYDRFKWDDPIGEVLLPLKNAKLSSCPVYWKDLGTCCYRKEGKGEVLLSVCYAPDYSRLNVVIQKAKELPAKDNNGSSDPYIKIWLIENGVKVAKKRTAVRSCTLSPVYNESFNFEVSKDKLDNVQLMVTAMDHDVVTKNDEMGYIVLGKSGTVSGRQHWKEMLEHQGYPITQWHRLCAPK